MRSASAGASGASDEAASTSTSIAAASMSSCLTAVVSPLSPAWLAAPSSESATGLPSTPCGCLPLVRRGVFPSSTRLRFFALVPLVLLFWANLDLVEAGEADAGDDDVDASVPASCSAPAPALSGVVDARAMSSVKWCP